MEHYRLKAWLTCRRIVRAAWYRIDDMLTRLDTHLASLGHYDDFDDDECDPCVCGSTDHSSVRVAYTMTNGLLQNGEFGSLPVDVVFSYDESDPLAVTMRVTLAVDVNDQVVGHDSTAWSFARDILDTAISREDEQLVGEGDVSVQHIPSQGDVWLWLTDGNNKRHRLDIDAGAITEFLAASYHLVPADSEVPPVDDAAIASLLDGTWEK